MELNDFKDAWTQYDKKLSLNLQLNMKMMRQLNLDKSKGEMQKIVQFEMFSVVVFFMMIIYVFSGALRLLNDLRFSIPGFISTLIVIVYAVFSLIKIKRFGKIEYYNTPIVQLQKELATFKVLVLTLRKYEMLLILPMAITLLPILFKSVHHIDIYLNPGWFITTVVMVIVLGFPLTIWVNRNLYDKKMQQAQVLLGNIGEFEEMEGEV